MAPDQLWNANIQYHSLLVEAIPHAARHVLDAGAATVSCRRSWLGPVCRTSLGSIWTGVYSTGRGPATLA